MMAWLIIPKLMVIGKRVEYNSGSDGKVFQIGRARSSWLIWNYHHDYSWIDDKKSFYE